MRKLNRSECAILTLVLKRRWYDMIASGEKTEEYRDVKPYYTTRLFNWCERMHSPRMKHLIVAFSLGYTRPSLFYTANMWPVQYALVVPYRRVEHPEWGEPGTPHYVIRLGQRVELEDGL